MLDLITKHESFIKSFHVLLYEQEEKLLRFKAQLIFIDDSKLFIKEYMVSLLIFVAEHSKQVEKNLNVCRG